MDSLQWIGEPLHEGGVTERRFNLEREAGTVPGILWTPTEHDGPLPLVLMGHGGSGHKRADRQLMLGRRFAGVLQMAAVAIDGPFHGDRVAEPLDRVQFQAMMAAAGVDKVTDGMVADWSATRDSLSNLDFIDADRIAYIGFSMGTRFGLPYVAAAGQRLRCALLCWAKTACGRHPRRQQPSTWPSALHGTRRPLTYRFSSTCNGMTNFSRGTDSSSCSTASGRPTSASSPFQDVTAPPRQKPSQPGVRL